MKIGVFGDSFADRSNPHIEKHGLTVQNESWIVELENQGHKVITYGKYGTSSFYSFEKFFEQYEQFEYIIFCYSSMDRCPVLPKGLETFSSMLQAEDLYTSQRYKGISNIELEKALVKILMAKPYLHSPSFALYLQQKIFNDVNLYCWDKNIRLVNVLSFETREKKLFNLDTRHFDVFYNLVEVSNREMPDMKFADPRYNHLSKENNKILAHKLVNSLMSKDTKNLVDLSQESDFIYDDEITKRYMYLMEELIVKGGANTFGF